MTDSSRRRHPRPPDELTPAEAAVALLVANGLTNAQIAARRACSLTAVEGHITRAAGKMPGEGRPRVKITRRLTELGWVTQRSA